MLRIPQGRLEVGGEDGIDDCAVIRPRGSQRVEGRIAWGMDGLKTVGAAFQPRRNTVPHGGICEAVSIIGWTKGTFSGLFFVSLFPFSL